MGLHALAVAQPVLSLTTDSPDLFIARKSPDLAVIAFGLWMVVGIPVLLLAGERAAASIRESVGWRLHLVILGAYLSLLALTVLKRADASLSLRAGIDVAGWVLILVALVVAALLVRLFKDYAIAHSYVEFLGLAAPAFFVMFLVQAPLEGVTPSETRQATRPAPVVLVIFDELPTASLLDPDGRIDRRRMPVFARLAATSSWFSSATTVADATSRAVPAILSGRQPSPSQRPTARDWPTNVFSLLRGQYTERSLEPATHLCPERTCRDNVPGVARATGSLIRDSGRIMPKVTAPTDLAERLPPILGEQGTLKDPSEDVERFLAGLRPERRPALSVLHVNLPHHPWRYLPNGRRYRAAGESALPRGFRDPLWTSDAGVVQANWRRHLLQAGYADTVLGKILRRLRRVRMLERSLLIVTADHGISFEPGHEARRATPRNLGGVALVPLFVKLPHQTRGTRVADHAETIDILPTILDAVGAEPGTLQGRSLLKAHRPSRQVAVLSSDGSTVRTPLSAALRQRRAVIRAQEALPEGLPARFRRR